MRMTYLVHILAGTLVVLSGYVALSATKGAPLHRRTGMVFVCAMLTTAVLGMVIAVVRGVAPAINVPAALLTSYLVITSLATVRPPAAGSRWLNIGALLVALAVTLASLTFAAEAFANGGTRKGMPAFPFIMFGVAALFASVGDVRMIRSGALTGAPRLARHLWRMCFALFIASISFFIGQADKLPKALRIYPLLVTLVLVPLVAMVYWRVRLRRTLRGGSIVGVHIAEHT